MAAATSGPEATARPVLDFDALYKAGTLECGDWSENCGRDDTLVGPRGAGWWTGKAPQDCPGYVHNASGGGHLTSLPLPRATASRQELLDYFDNTWTLTEVLFASLQPVTISRSFLPQCGRDFFPRYFRPSVIPYVSPFCRRS